MFLHLKRSPMFSSSWQVSFARVCHDARAVLSAICQRGQFSPCSHAICSVRCSLFALRRNCCEMWGDHKTCLLHLMTTTDADGVVAANAAAGFIICHRVAMMAAGAGGHSLSSIIPMKLGKGCVKRCNAFTGFTHRPRLLTMFQ